MADKHFLDSFSSSPAHNTNRLARTSHQNGGPEAGPGQRSPSVTRQASGSSSPLRTLWTLAGLMSPNSEGRPRGQNLGSSFRNRTPTSKRKVRTSQQEDPDALLDLILDSQSQRLEDQRASLSLLSDSEPAASRTCDLDHSTLPSIDFYYMLIQYQSDRMEDQRCSLPELDHVLVPVPEGQEDFFRLIQRVQSRRMDEQRALMLLRQSKDDQDHSPAGSTHHHLHH